MLTKEEQIIFSKIEKSVKDIFNNEFIKTTAAIVFFDLLIRVGVGFLVSHMLHEATLNHNTLEDVEKMWADYMENLHKMTRISLEGMQENDGKYIQ